MFRTFQLFRGRQLSISTWFVVVAATGTVCALAIGALAAWYSWEQQKLRFGQGLMATSRALIESSDRELEQAGVALRAVATSGSFRNGDLAGFRNRAFEFLAPYGYFLIVSQPGSARELMNTAVQSASSLPELPANWTNSSNDGGDIKVRPVSQIVGTLWAVGLQTIAATSNGSKYLLTLGIPANRFQQLIDAQGFSREAFPVILDQNWAIVARQPYGFIGQQGANRQLKDIPPPDSVYEARVLEGVPTLHGRSRSEKFGWTVAIAMPKAELAKLFLGPSVVVGLSGFAISLLAAGAIGFLAVRIGRDVDILSEATHALSDRRDYALPKFEVKELATVAENMKNVASKLASEEQFRKRVVEELAHRLRNKIATIQAIIGYQLRAHPHLRDEIFSRLTALSATDELIVASQGYGAELADIVKAELVPFQTSRVSADGPKIFLEPKLALTMALLLHELATNASKYGALSSMGGTVTVRWSAAGNKLNIEWRERGGPVVVKPERHGFGSRLVAGILASFGGTIHAQFEPEGLVCHVCVELPDQTPRMPFEDSGAKSTERSEAEMLTSRTEGGKRSEAS
jgi:two-component sensor histidine kinase